MYHRILVPIDGSATAERGLHEAIRLAAELKATLHVLHVLDDFPSEVEWSPARQVEETLNRLRRQGNDLLTTARHAAQAAGVSVQTQQREVTRSTTADAILDEVAKNGCDLVVMGTHGRRGFNRLALGSTAEAVARRSTVPLLMTRQPAAA